MTLPTLSVVIPTYGRESVLLKTIEDVLNLDHPPDETVIVDQTSVHEPATEQTLRDWHDNGRIRWMRREVPSIPISMNAGLAASSSELVLFLDDDLIPGETLIESHKQSHGDWPDACAVVGQVLQPGENPGPLGERTGSTGIMADMKFPFWSDQPAWVSNVMAGNLSVKRERAIAAGGFDENFIGAAYRFETEFARRLIRGGCKIRFEPGASIKHLRASRGGTRSSGSHMASASPLHGVGDYYFAMSLGLSPTSLGYMLRRPFREVRTRFHLRRPWYIPVKLFGESRAMYLAVQLRVEGARLMSADGILKRIPH